MSEAKALKRKTYSPRETAEVKNETLSKIIDAQHSMRKADVRTDLHQTEEVKRITDEYFSKCRDAAICPSFEGIAAACGVSRKWMYEFMRLHPDSETTKYFQIVQTELAAIRTAAAEKGCVDPTFAIFTLLNSDQGYSNRHDVVIEPAQTNPLEISPEDVEAVRSKYIEALPDDDE